MSLLDDADEKLVGEKEITGKNSGGQSDSRAAEAEARAQQRAAAAALEEQQRVLAAAEGVEGILSARVPPWGWRVVGAVAALVCAVFFTMQVLTSVLDDSLLWYHFLVSIPLVVVAGVVELKWRRPDGWLEAHTEEVRRLFGRDPLVRLRSMVLLLRRPGGYIPDGMTADEFQRYAEGLRTTLRLGAENDVVPAPGELALRRIISLDQGAGVFAAMSGRGFQLLLSAAMISLAIGFAAQQFKATAPKTEQSVEKYDKGVVYSPADRFE